MQRTPCKGAEAGDLAISLAACAAHHPRKDRQSPMYISQLSFCCVGLPRKVQSARRRDGGWAALHNGLSQQTDRSKILALRRLIAQRNLDHGHGDERGVLTRASRSHARGYCGGFARLVDLNLREYITMCASSNPLIPVVGISHPARLFLGAWTHFISIRRLSKVE